MEIAHTRKMEWPEVSEGRFGSLIRTDSPEGCQVALLGVPDDTGVQMNHGNPGAAQGPDALRVALTRYGTSEPDDWVWPTVYDAGDVVTSGELSETHDRVTHATSTLLDAGLFPIMVGGGHDLTFPFVRAAAKHYGEMNGIYLDAHLDVREEEGSGMPFRRLIEECSVKRLDIIGFSHFTNSREHARWFHSHGGRIDALEPGGMWPGDNIFLSLDLDAIDVSSAPGVSAQNPMGMSVHEVAKWVHAAGANNRVRCFDIMELCPPNDLGGKTARVAAHLLLTFLKGYATRLGSHA
ncbi:MAG: formimidoylglutamase [Phycisphaerales bacterium]